MDPDLFGMADIVFIRFGFDNYGDPDEYLILLLGLFVILGGILLWSD